MLSSKVAKPDMELTIRIFDRSQIMEAVSLYQKVFKSEPWNVNDSDEEVTEYFSNMLSNDMFLGYAAYYNGRIAALSAGFVKPWVKGFEYYIDQFCVDIDLQGKGIGTEFLAFIEKDLHGKRINNIFLLTVRAFPSYGFYKKNGFIDNDRLCCLSK